ncbi:AEC family transporter [Butyrivibrio sp. AE3004]|uniref:AEC family transporter n=1 Tax=Butyrivibrio sp. AE3004 TaxID=1506994 RepID=UPI000493B8E3|nr:AEC family transporter [Butyrivibrio sp. AE3004]
MILLPQMFMLFMLMTVGIICRKTGLMDDRISKGMSGIVVNIASPAFILSAGINKDEVVTNRQLLACVIASVVIYLGLILISIFIPNILRLKKNYFGTYRVMTIFSNIGFMGFPIVSATYGDVGLLYAAFFQFPFNLLIYTYGIRAMRSGTDVDFDESFSWKNIINVGVISVFVSLLLYMTHVHIPEPIEDVVSSLSGLTVPMSMMVIGYSLGGMKLKSLFEDYKLMIFSALKLIVIPIISVLLMKLFIKDQILLGVCFVMIATPVASMSAMLAQYYGGDEETASRGVALTTLLSVLTIPLVGAICL